MGGTFFTGLIDEVVIYSKALSDAEVDYRFIIPDHKSSGPLQRAFKNIDANRFFYCIMINDINLLNFFNCFLYDSGT